MFGDYSYLIIGALAYLLVVRRDATINRMRESQLFTWLMAVLYFAGIMAVLTA